MIKATPLSVGFQGSTVGAIEKRLKRPNGLGWFAYEPQGVNLANLEFSILETSKPGALANALVATAKANKDAIQQAVAGYVYSSPPTPAQNVGLAEVALKEYKVYADLHQNAVEAYAQDEQNPLNIDARNQYNALKRQVSCQFDVVKAAWTAARISQRPVELAPLK